MTALVSLLFITTISINFKIATFCSYYYGNKGNSLMIVRAPTIDESQ